MSITAAKKRRNQAKYWEGHAPADIVQHVLDKLATRPHTSLRATLGVDKVYACVNVRVFIIHCK